MYEVLIPAWDFWRLEIAAMMSAFVGEVVDEPFKDVVGDMALVSWAVLLSRKHEWHSKLFTSEWVGGELEKAPQFEWKDCWQEQHVADLELLYRV